jgi:hypothetical protein
MAMDCLQVPESQAQQGFSGCQKSAKFDHYSKWGEGRRHNRVSAMTMGLETHSQRSSDQVRTENSNLLPNVQDHRDVFATLAKAGAGSLPSVIDFSGAPDIYAGDRNKPSAQHAREAGLIAENTANTTGDSAARNIQIDEKVGAAVSPQFKKGVDEWVHEKIPANIQQIMHDHHIGITIYENPSQMPKAAREMQARRHASGEKYSNLKMFYDPSSHSLVFVENPDPKPNSKPQQEGAGANTTYQVGPDRETAFHELGHALDYQFLNHISQSKEFDDAFKLDNGKLTPLQIKNLGYYHDADSSVPKAQQEMAAKEECMAQLFAALITPERMRSIDSQRLMDAYPDVVKAMRKHMQGLLPDESANR